MKRFVLMIAFCLVFIGTVSTSYAQGPYLACDPMTVEVTQIDVDIGGTITSVAAADIIKRADAWLLVDLSTTTAGSYTAKAKAIYGTWGPSDWSSDFLFVKPVLTEPAGMKLAR